MSFILSQIRYEAVLRWGMKNLSQLEVELNSSRSEFQTASEQQSAFRDVETWLLEEASKIPGEGILGGLGEDTATFFYADTSEAGVSLVETSYNVSTVRELARAAESNLSCLVKQLRQRIEAVTAPSVPATYTPLNIIGTKVNAIGIVLMAIDAGLFDDRITDSELAKLFRAETDALLTEDSISSIRQKLGGQTKTNDASFVQFIVLCLHRLSAKHLTRIESEVEALIDQSNNRN